MKDKKWNLLFEIYDSKASISEFLEELIDLGATDFDLLETKWREKQKGKE